MSEIDKNYPLTKELIKDLFTNDFVKKHLAEGFSIFEVFDFFKLKTSSKNKECFEKIRKKSFEDWTEAEKNNCSLIFIEAFLKNLDKLEINDSILVQIADGAHYCFSNYADYREENLLNCTFDSVLSGHQPTDAFGYGFGAKNCYCYVQYNYNSGCEYTYYFSESEEKIFDISQEFYVFERSLMSESDWQEYFPDQDLDEVFGFSLDDIETK